MACEILSGIVGVCQYSTSGAEKLWLSNKDSLTGSTIYSVDVSGEITGMTWSGGTVVVYEIEAALDTITFSDDLAVNGSRRNFLQTVNFSVGSLSSTILGTIEDIGLSNLVAFVKLSDGTYRGFGLKGTGLRATVITDTSGTAGANDANLAVTLSGTNLAKAPYVSATYAATMGLD